MGAPVQISNLHRFEGAFKVAAVSGVLTGVAAETGTAGFLWAMQWAPVTAGKQGVAFCMIQRLRARLTTIHGPTATQEIGIDLTIARAFTAATSGGTAITFGTNDNKKRTKPFSASLMADMRIGNTGALTAGTHTLDANPIASASCSEVAFSATVPPTFAEINLTTQDLEEYPVILANQEGLILRNTILQGTAYTGRLVVEVDWREAVRV